MEDETKKSKYYEWDGSFKNIKYMFYGAASLRSAFWGVFMVCTAVIIVIPLILVSILAGFTSYNYPFELLVKYAPLLTGLVQIIFIYPVIKCSKNTDKSYWTYITVVFCVLVIFSNISEGIKNI